MDSAWRHTDRRHDRWRQPRPRQLRPWPLVRCVQPKRDVYDNDIHDNLNWSILYEISFGGTKIHDDTLRDNGGDDRYGWFQRGSTSRGRLPRCNRQRGGIAILDNSIDGTAYTVGLFVNGNRPLTRGVYVHDNSVTLRAAEARVGAVAFQALSVCLVRR
jgi:hypothetical protein